MRTCKNCSYEHEDDSTTQCEKCGFPHFEETFEEREPEDV